MKECIQAPAHFKQPGLTADELKERKNLKNKYRRKNKK